jgi:penicillin-binding protein 1C
MQRRGSASARFLRGGLVLVAALLLAGALLLAVVGQRMEPLALAPADALSVTVLDRNDRLLRAYTTPDGRWRLPIEPEEVDQRYLAMLIRLEDKRFYTHRGVDAAAFLRAAWLLLRHRHIVSGASTLTMQVVRLLQGEHERSALGKLRQMLNAFALERRQSKRAILRLYLRLAPFGGNLEGVRAAALAYFGKEPRRLSPAEAALLVALPQSPKLRRPDRFPETARRARNKILELAQRAGIISREEAMRARSERMPLARRPFPLLAAHLADAEVAQNDRLVHRLTIDAGAQAQLQSLLKEHINALGGRLSAALIALEHESGAVIAHVGSPGYLDDARFGAVDMTAAVRSPGSTLKPLIYGLAFETGLAHPETLIEDRPARFGHYVPRNFDSDWHGTVSVRTALAQSLNIPAVKVLDALGPARLYGRLRQTGILPVLPNGAEPSLAIALGGLGLRLTDLASLYAGLARGGTPVTLKYRLDDSRAMAGQTRLLAEVAAWYVSDILRNAPAPAHAKPGQIAYKTGTSYGFRDAWAIGYDGRHTVAVWVGRPDGAATPGLAGRTAAAPLLFDAFARLSPHRTPLPGAPAGALRVLAKDLPPPLKRFREAVDAAGGPPEAPLQIAFPPDRSELEVEELESGSANILAKAEGGALPLTWLIDGVPIRSDPARRDAWLPTPRPGFLKLSVIDARGQADRVMFRVK